MCSWRIITAWVLTVGYPGGKTRQPGERASRAGSAGSKGTEEYRDVKQALEAISELNHLAPAGSRGSQRTGTPVVIAARRLQRNFADGFIAETVEDLWEPWMRHADKALEDDTLLLVIQEELAKRCRKSKTRGRKATPAEVVLRMLLLEACTRLELRSNCRGKCAPIWSIASSPGSAVEKVPDDRDDGKPGASAGAGGYRKTAPAGGGDRAGKQDRNGS